MKKIITAVVICFILAITNSCLSKTDEEQYYWIDKWVTVLGFVGDPNSLNFTPVKFITYRKQRIKLFHKKSGPGLYAFYLPNLLIQNEYGLENSVWRNGFFVVKKSQVRLHKYANKISLKYKSRKEFKDARVRQSQMRRDESYPDIW